MKKVGIISVAVLGCILLGVGLFLLSKPTSKEVTELVGNTLSVYYENGTTISLKNAQNVPLEEQTPYEFQITNLRSTPSMYNVSLKENLNITNKLEREELKITVVKNGEVVVDGAYLNSFGSNLEILSNCRMEANTMDSYQIYLYIDGRSETSIGKNYEAILQITKIDLTSEEASDQEPPIIELAGEQNIMLFQNDEFVDPGIKQIIDNQDGNISADNVSIRYEYYDGTTHENVSHVDTSRIGFFYIYYTVKDKASNETQAIRVVTVQAPDSENPDSPQEPEGTFLPEVRYETLETGEVLVTITADEPLKDLVPWSKSQDGKTLSQVFSTNMRMTLIVFSETGHSAILTIEVTNVNKSDATEEEKDPVVTPPANEMSVTFTTKTSYNSVTITTQVRNEVSGTNYQYQCGDGSWSTPSNQKEYTCQNLSQNTSYKVSVQAVKKDGTIISSPVATVKTMAIPLPTFQISSANVETTKELTITYPEIEGFTNYYKIDNGDEVETTATQTVTLTHNASITAIVRDNSNSQNQVNSTYVETKIDSAAPVISNTNITTSNIGETVATIRYQQASDDFTANLKYSICISTSSIDSSYCLQNPTTTKEGETTHTFTNLNPSTTYYVLVLVSDSFGRTSSYQMTSFTTSSAAAVWGEHFEISNKSDLVGINFSTWFDYMQNKSSGIYNITNILAGNGSFGNIGDFHYWGEPAKGYYKSTDKAVIREQMTELYNMGVDFIIIDNTNATLAWISSAGALDPNSVFYEAVYAPMKALLDTVVEMRQEGLPTPYVANWVNTNDDYVMLNVMHNLFTSATYDPSLGNEKYEDVWVYWDGKPFFLVTKDQGTPDRDITYRVMWGLQTSVANGEWSYLQKDNSKNKGTNWSGAVEQMSVSVAMQQNRMSNTGSATGRNHGITFYNQWQNAFATRPKIITLTWWNEWGAERLDPSTNVACGTYCFTDNYNQEYSRDIEPQKGGLGSTYYDWTTQYIRAYKNHQSVPRLVESGY